MADETGCHDTAESIPRLRPASGAFLGTRGASPCPGQGHEGRARMKTG